MRKLVIGSWTDLVQRLRRTGTAGDPDLRPYQSARIDMKRVRIAELVPLAKYVLEEQLQSVARLGAQLSAQDVDIFELGAGIVWPEGLDERPLSCPIVEQWDREGLLLVDGLHRVWVARDQSRAEVTCAVIRDVVVPLVPLPVAWEDVKVFPMGQRPGGQDKRAYRFSDASSLRFAFPPISDKVTDQNARYFLYRKLDELGSSGIRPPAASLSDPTESTEPEANEGNDKRP